MFILNLYLWRIVLWIVSYPDNPMLFSASKSHEVLKDNGRPMATIVYHRHLMLDYFAPE